MINVKLDNKAKNTVAKTLNLGEGQGGSQQYATAYMYTNGYLSAFTFICEDPNIETFRDLVQYLHNKGFRYYDGNEESYLPCSGQYNDDGFILAGGLSSAIFEDEYFLYVATADTGDGRKEIQEDEFLEFSISYLGQE